MIATLFLLLIACDDAFVSEPWRIDRLRVLAIAADPAEPRPGDTVTFRSLVVGPPEAPPGIVVYVGCLTGDPSEGCALDGAAIEAIFADGAIDAEEQQVLLDAGLLGVEPFLAPTWTIPADALDTLEPSARAEGLTVFVNVSAFPELAEGEEVSEDDVELAFKRMPISEALTPNHNPTVSALLVDGVALAEGATVTLDRGQTYDIDVRLAEDAVETYTYVPDDGPAEERDEAPYFTWFTEEGVFDQSTAVWPETARRYTTPTDPARDTSRLWAVARDRRGGMGWIGVNVRWR